MGALSGSASYLRFAVRGDPPNNFPTKFEQAIEARRFLPLDPDAEEIEATGWVPLEAPLDDERPVTRDLFHFGDLVAVGYREDKFALPRALVKHKALQRLAKVEAERSAAGEDPPPKSLKREIEKAVISELKRQVLPRSRVVDVVWNLATREARIFAKGPIAVERCAALFERTFEIPLTHLTYAQHAFNMDLSSRAKSVLEGLRPAPPFDALAFEDEDL